MLYLKSYTTVQNYIYSLFIFQAEQSTSESIISINNKRSFDVQDLFGNTDDINFDDEECKFSNIYIIIKLNIK